MLLPRPELYNMIPYFHQYAFTCFIYQKHQAVEEMMMMLCPRTKGGILQSFGGKSDFYFYLCLMMQSRVKRIKSQMEFTRMAQVRCSFPWNSYICKPPLSLSTTCAHVYINFNPAHCRSSSSRNIFPTSSRRGLKERDMGRDWILNH